MSFKKLNLDRSLVEKYLEDAKVDGTLVSTQLSGIQQRCEFLVDGNTCLLIIYFNKDGTTTIVCNVGKNIEISESLAADIVRLSKLSDLVQATCTFKHVSEDDFELTREYITEEIPGANVEIQAETANEVQLKITGIADDHVTLKYWKSTKTTLLQGKPLPIFQAVKLIFYDLLPEENIIESENEVYKVNLTVQDCRSTLEKHMPKAFKFLDDKVKKIMSPSLTLDKINGEFDDYAMFCFPALKGLEGYIRQLLLKTNTSYSKTRKIGSLYSEKYPFSMADHVMGEIKCPHMIEALEKTYNYYNSKRHPYFHVGQVVQASQVIERKEDAQALNVEVFNIIESTFNKLP